ncbi:hypothetical protein BPC006_II0076 [Burkholderia pseudomallei BPC006]|nr:hypothetical protein BPC006_II0076 [Burkholderia pseudomallei BPC006]
MSLHCTRINEQMRVQKGSSPVHRRCGKRRAPDLPDW